MLTLVILFFNQQERLAGGRDGNAQLLNLNFVVPLQKLGPDNCHGW